MSDPAPEKETGTPPSVEKEAGPPATTDTIEPEKKKREYKDFGHDEEKPTRELYFPIAYQWPPLIGLPHRRKGRYVSGVYFPNRFPFQPLMPCRLSSRRKICTIRRRLI